MTTTLKQLQQLVMLSEERNFRRAAERLFMAQPALSVSIRKMEHQIGVKLVQRDSRGATLTPAGEAMLQEARSALFHAEQALRLARGVGAGEVGSLRLGFVNSAIHELLPATLSRFRTHYPEIQFELSEDSTWEIIRRIEAYELDAGIVRGPIALSANLKTWVIEHDDLMLVVPEHHRFADREYISLKECQSEEFVLFGSFRTPGLHSVALGLCHAAGFTPRISQEAIQVQTLVGLVASGTGIALVPTITRNHTRARARFIPLTDPGARQCLSLSLTTRREQISPTVRRLCEVMMAVAGTARS
ncbi:LysR family transcriptional regulator [Castellaniella sp.]|uniref:LysR family transcriptional regulator n=1 Tax=Castellaniella sp. TaxID=1955812 RepID=UPI003565F868